MRILFLGNSFTFFNDLPGKTAALLDAECTGNLRGGAYLRDHLNPADELCAATRRLLTEERWDYVVLQDQSRGPITDPEDFHRSVAALCPMIRAAGAKPILYETWAYREGSEKLASTGLSFDAMQQGLSQAYAEAARRNDALLARVGQAFSDVRHTVDLYCEDDYHPSDAASCIAARVLADLIRANQ